MRRASILLVLLLVLPCVLTARGLSTVGAANGVDTPKAKPRAAARTTPKTTGAAQTPATGKKTDKNKTSTDTAQAATPQKPSVSSIAICDLPPGTDSSALLTLLTSLSMKDVSEVLVSKDGTKLLFLMDTAPAAQAGGKVRKSSTPASLTACSDQLKTIVNSLAQAGGPETAMTASTPLPSRHVESLTQRLFYINEDVDVGKVVAAINAMYPDVTASVVSTDSIQLSMTVPPAGTAERQTDTIWDARRAIAKIDQPRPRASLDAWAIQIASEDPQSLEFLTPKIEEITSAYNEVMSESILNGWRVLTQTSSELDPVFSDYISDVTVAKTTAAKNSTANQAQSSQNTECCFVGNTREDALRTETKGYGLGYQTMFEPVTPNLIDMLVSLVGQKEPVKRAGEVLDAMEGPFKPSRQAEFRSSSSVCTSDCTQKAFNILDISSESAGAESLLCRREDVEIYRDWVDHMRKNANCGTACGKPAGIVVPPAMSLSCVRAELQHHLFLASDIPVKTSAFGQMRAAIADFLYQYKLMEEYPDEFHAYLEPMSADTLDMALLPVVDAFYDDLGAFQEAMQNQVYGLLQAQNVSYSSSGLVSIKMIAGTPGTVDSTSQNSFKMSQGASAADIATAIASINTDPADAAAGLLKALTPTPVTATLGKELSVTTTVHSLSGAYGMELDLDINSAENGAPQLVKSGATPTKDDDLNSRVTTHKLKTKVRVDSLKLFEVSTARSLVARGQEPWMPLDPYFEVPVLSQLIKRPRKPKAVYTQSLIFVDALVVPTAIDLGFGTPFVQDAVASAPGNNTGRTDDAMQEVNSLQLLSSDKSRFGIDSYHSAMVDHFTRQYLDGTGKVVSEDASYAKPTWRPGWPGSTATAPAEDAQPSTKIP